MTRQTFRPILLALLMAVGAARPPEAMAQDCPRVLTLPDDQESLTCTIEDWASYLIRWGVNASEIPAYNTIFSGSFLIDTERRLRVSASGPVEVILALEETVREETVGDPGPGGGFELGVGYKIVGNVYRVVLDDPDNASLILALAMTGAAAQNVRDAFEYAWNIRADLKVIVRRLPMQCSMWARVSGDVNDTFYGDVAYYMHSTSGVMVDPEQMAMFGLLMGEDMANEFAKVLAEEMQDPDKKEEGDENKGAEKFMLVLQDFKLDQETDDALEVFGILAGQFSLGITADLVPSEDPAKAKLLIDEVQATVGAIEGSGDRMLFENIEATGPEPALTILQYEGTDLAYGTFSGDLTTRGQYSLAGAPSRRLRVHIDANYTALKGQYTCAKR